MIKMLPLLVIFISSIAQASEINIKKSDGLFNVKNSDNIFITTSYVAWGEGWKWDAPKVKMIDTPTNALIFQLKFKKQDIETELKIEHDKKNITYNYNQQFNKSLHKTIGAGIDFKLDLSNQMRLHGAKEPKLLPDNDGWSWEFESGKTIEIRFSPKIAKVYFEKGNKSRIRALFFTGKTTRGNSRVSMKISIPEDSKFITFSKTNKSSSWLSNTLSTTESFIDLSKLNHKPAGNRGFIKAVGEHFEFNDGNLIRFFGTNVQANSLFINDKDLIKQHAKRIASLGFNLVRLHHHDSLWVNPNVIRKGQTTQEINDKALDTYFWWVKCLKDEGVYVWVDLQVQRPWREGDELPGWDTDLAPKAKKGMNVAKGFIYLNKRMQDLTKKFNTEFLTRVNPYTKLALTDEPAVMGIMITNENDLTSHFGNAFLKNKNHPYHQRIFDREVDTFAKKFDMPAYKVRETWKPGLSKYLLNDLEARFNIEMIKHLRSLGVKGPITTTSLWGRNSALYSLPSLTTGDMVDAHSYAGGGIFKKSLLQEDPHHTPNFLHALGQGQVANKPFTITEYNVEQRNDLDSAYIPTVSVAAMGAFQGWDATMLYGYSQDGLHGHRASPWSSYTHPAIMGVVPAMALLYRQGHVAQAKKTVVLAPANDEIFTKKLSPKTSVAIRTALEQHRMVVAMPETKILPWLSASKIDKNAIIVNNLNKDLLPPNQNYIESDTGELRRNWRKGTMTVNTPKSQLAMGKIGGQNIDLDDVSVQSETPEAAVIFSSLDNRAIKSSERILLSAVARVAKVKIKWKSSYVSEPVKATLSLKSIHKDLHLVPLQSDGSEGQSRALKRMPSGKYSFTISENDRTHWYLIRR